MLVAWVRVELMTEWTVSQSGECVHKGRGRQRERGRERQTDDWTDRRVGRERDTVVRTEIVLGGLVRGARSTLEPVCCPTLLPHLP